MDPVERLKLVDMLKKRMRKDNWNFLSRHKEVRAIIRFILNEAIREKPDNLYNFVAGMFHCDNMEKLTKEINTEIQRVGALLKNSAWSEYDGEMLFPVENLWLSCCAPGSTTHDSILSFSLIEKEPDNIENAEPGSENNTLDDSVISITKL